MNILFPTDFSENSELALNYAMDFIKKTNGKLTLLSVYEVPEIESVSMGSLSEFSSGPGGRLQQKVANDTRLDIEKKLSSLLEKYNLPSDRVKTLAVQGAIKTEIDHLLQVVKYDLIVLGTKGENTQKGVFFGGIAKHLIKTASCPVIAVPFNAKYSDVKRIIYPTDLAHEEKNSLNWLINYARMYDAKLHLVHITDTDVADKTSLMEELVDELVYDKLDFEIIEGADVSKIILDMSKKDNCDIVGMTTHTITLFDRVFHSSFTEGVLDKIDIPFIGFSQKDTVPYQFD